MRRVFFVPQVTDIKFLTPSPPLFTEQRVSDAAQRLFGLEGNLKALYSERDQNFRIDTGEQCYVIKIANREEDLNAVDLQIRALLHIAQCDPLLPVPRVVPARNGSLHEFIEATDGTRHLVRVLSYLPGQVMVDAPRSAALYEDVGRTLARCGLALRGFFHPAAGYDLLWDLRKLNDLRPLTRVIDDKPLRGSLDTALEQLVSNVLPQVSSMRAQIIHNDANLYNLLVDATNPAQITGLVDFGDMLHAPLIFDLAIAAGSMTFDNPDPLESLCHLTRAYDSVLPLEEGEINALPQLALGRVIQELLIAAKRQVDDPESSDYVLANLDASVSAVEALLAAGHAQVRNRLRDACRFPKYCPVSTTKCASDNLAADNTGELLGRRSAVLGASLELAYNKPFHVLRGEGVWLYDADGRRHLDAYNNVPHVGHCHPQVVKAVSRQLGTLNTNTRYLFDNVVSYAERLGALLPGKLGSCIFVNSGSEANDAAMRMARTLTGKQGAIVMADAYHGISESIDELSPGAYPGAEPPSLADRVRVLAAPDLYRGQLREAPDAIGTYAGQVDDALNSLKGSGHGTAAFMVDCSFSSNGILSPLPGYLSAVTKKVRAAGGLIIADEVQIGFGRSGTHMWGFEAQGFMPDIVTLGKPIANGLSMGAVVTTPDIRDAFGKQIDFFSTFGGNPVASAAAHAVLDVIEGEGLMENARLSGEYLRKGLRELATQYPVIGDVRGQGLFVGVDIVRDPDSRERASDIADGIRNHLRENRVLVGRDSRAGNVIKIRPPMVFEIAHVDILLGAFDAALATTMKHIFQH